MRTGWTGGQYSLWRVALAVFLLVFVLRGAMDTLAVIDGGGPFRHAWIDEEPIDVRLAGAPLAAAFAIALAASVAILVGWRDRLAAFLLAAMFFWVGCVSTNALGVALPIGFLTCVHVALPSAPYGSVAARGRPDPGGEWRSTPRVGCAVRVFVGLGAAFVAATEVEELLLRGEPGLYVDFAEHEAREGAVLLRLLDGAAPEYVYCGLVATTLARFVWLPLALWPRAWSVLFCLVLLDGLIRVSMESPDRALDTSRATCVLGLALLFDPAWIPARGGGAVERVFFDGDCGLCHRAVRFVLAEDVDGRRFRFAPLQGTTFASEVDAATRAKLPDSILVKTVDGRLLARSDAVLHLLAGLGGLWRVLGALLALVPRPVRDFGYDAVARSRRTWFKRPEALCPLLPAHLARRFEA